MIPVLAIFGLIALPGSKDGEAADFLLYVDQQCVAEGVSAYLTWSGTSPDATQQWVDISLMNDGWQPGSFAGGGPLAADAWSHTWGGLTANTVFYVRVNQLLATGQWLPSPTFYFQTLECDVSPVPAPRAPFDMTGGHDGVPLGVPSSYSWQGGPEIQASVPPAGWPAMLGWGQVYSDASQGVPPDNLRVQIAGMTIYALAGDSWRLLQDVSVVGGGYYLPTYNGAGIAAIERHELDGGVSVAPYAGRPYHFFPAARVAVPGNLSGVVVAIRARLILDDPAGPDTRSEARLMLGAGLDWFGGLAGNTKSRGACVGPMTWLTSEYQTFVCHTFRDASVLDANPPPLP